MKKMNLDASSVEELNPEGALLSLLETVVAEGINAGMPKGWLCDLAFATVAVHMVRRKVSAVGEDTAEAKALLTSLSNTQFNAFQETNAHSLGASLRIRNRFIKDVVTPLYDAYQKDEETKKAYPGIESLFLQVL